MNRSSLYSIIALLTLTSHNAKSQDFQLYYPSDIQASNYNPFSRSVFAQGINSFLKDTFNAPAYAQEFLPNNFNHLIELLEYGNKAGKDAVYVKSVLRLFCNKIKASSYVNAYSFQELLLELPSLLERYCTINAEGPVVSLKDIIFELQCQSFKSQFPEFKSNPELFLSKLSQSIEDAAELRKLINLLLEICLNKAIWSPDDQEQTWYNVKELADSLELMHYKTIIPDLEDLNSLCITLLERYCLFLDIAHPYLDVNTFNIIKDDIAICRTPLFDLEEQEDVLETKLHRFSRCLTQLEAKRRAWHEGIIVA